MKRSDLRVKNQESRIKVNPSFRTVDNPRGFTMVLFLVAVLVLFTTVSFIKLSTMQTIDPDLTRIGINLGPKATPNNLAENTDEGSTQSSDEQAAQTDESKNELSVASSALDVDGDSEGEADNPPYIE